MYQPRPRVEKYKNSFLYKAGELWNALPDDIIAFEKELDRHWENQELKYDNFKAEIKTTALHLSNYL